MASPLLSVAATRETQQQGYFVARSTRGLLRRGIGHGFAFRTAVTKFLTLCPQSGPPAARIALTASCTLSHSGPHTAFMQSSHVRTPGWFPTRRGSIPVNCGLVANRAFDLLPRILK